MKNNIRLLGSVCAALLMVGTSCSLIQKKENTAQVMPVEIPKDRKPVVPARASATYTPQEIKQGVVKGDWAIEEVDGKKAVGETAPYIKFEPVQKRIYGNDGCNTLNGSYKYSAADRSISFSQLITTMKACAETGITDTEINMALNAATNYRLEEKGQQYWLYLTDATGKTVLALMHQNFDFLNGTWLVQSIKERKAKDIEDLQTRMQQFYQTAQTEMQRKQQELAQPLHSKLQDAVDAVGKEGSFTVILYKDVMMYYATPAVDVTPLVRTKLGIK